MGMATDDVRIRQAPELAKEAGLEVHISTGDIDGAHPNTAKVTLTDANGRQVSLLGSSIGGGNMEVSLTGQYTTLIVLHKDAPGTIAAVTEVMAEEGINICNFRLSRQKKGGEAVMTIELDGKPSPEINKKINTLPNIYSSTMLQPI
jgi:L-serine dehydratase